ncbi:hypothetical protein [Desmospora profundinema]|uniref:Uncharacterized protein n=1 Tax=Desmospora profundinema TaxID=1571184 RepID=A0ABU1IK35_9BACL|nr:hypothetical protein [Desmospora profundinema]MDR6224514.1 hypothetical protein [Desmospora profundinema]
MSNPRRPQRPHQGQRSRVHPPRPRAKQTPRPSSPELSKINLSTLVNGFFTFRTTVKDLSQTLHRLENIMDNAYQMFEMASQWAGSRGRPRRRPPLRLIQPRRGPGEEIPHLDLPMEEGPMGRHPDSTNPLFKLMENVDMGQLFKLMQSPVVQQLLRGMMQARTPEAKTRARKQG